MDINDSVDSMFLFRYTMTLDSDTSITLSNDSFYLDIQTCQVKFPDDLNAHTEYKFNIKTSFDPVILDLTTASLGSCGLTHSLTVDG